MNSEQSKLRQEQRVQQEQRVSEQLGVQASGKEFRTVEELLRYDSEQNRVPSEVGERLNDSMAAEPKPAKPWYKSLFGF